MCKVIEDMRKQERAEGFVEGRVEGRAEGRLDAIAAIMESLSVPAEKAMDLLKIPAKERKSFMEKLPTA